MLKPILCILVLMIMLTASPLYADNDNEGNGDKFLEEVSEGLGVVALWGFIGLNALYYYSMVLGRMPREARTALPASFIKPVMWKSRFRRYHYLGNPVMIAVACLHGIWAEESNFLLWAGWGFMVLLAFSGWTMKNQKADEPGAKVGRLIHFQHAFSIIMLLTLVIGHALAD